MAGPFRSPGDFTHFVKKETTYATDPTIAAADAFMSRAAAILTKIIERRDRDMDGDGLTSVVSTQLGRESGTFDTGECDVVPSGNATTPTAPDMGPFFDAHMGQVLTGTAHTTTTTGSTTTVLELTAGGAAAAGIVVGMIVVVDVSAAIGYEAREVTIVATDTVTLDRALSGAPASGRAVKTSVTYRIDGDVLQSLWIAEYLGQGNNFRHTAAGALPAEMKTGCDFTQATPVVTVQFSGPCAKVDPGTTSYPTPTTAGLPMIPTATKLWVGATGALCMTSFEVTSHNGTTIRNDQSCQLYATSAKRTENNGRWNVNLKLVADLETGATFETIYDGQDALSAYDILIQLGITPGSSMVLRMRNWIPKADITETGGLVSIDSDGRCYATTEENELVLAFW